MKILISRPGIGIGDHLMVTTGLRGVREKHPLAEIHLHVRKPIRYIYKNNPNIDQFVKNYRRGRELYRYASGYDHFYNLKRIIEGNPIAEVENAYDLICQKLNVTPSNMLPEIFFSNDEYATAKKILFSAGLSTSKDKLILIHGQASSFVRRLSNSTIIQLAEYYANNGYQVGILGNGSLINRWDLKCDGIRMLHSYGSEYGIRTMFALLSYARMFIGTDSCFSHMAAALEIPSVIIYGPFDAYLRAKYFSKAICIQNPVRCGPCHLHPKGGQCPIYVEEIPPCMTKATCDLIVNKGDYILSLNRDDLKSEVKQSCRLNGQVQCHICNHNNVIFYKRIGIRMYYRCQNCSSVFC